MITQIAFGLNVLLVLIVLYYLIRPGQILAKKPNLTAKGLRNRLGIGLALGLIGIGLRLPALIESLRPEETASAEMDQKLARVEAIYRERLTRYDEKAKTRPFTKYCIPFQVAELRKQYPQFTENLMTLAATDSCSCMAFYLQDLPEFAKAETAMEQGKDYESAMNETMDMNMMMEKAKPCMEL